MKYKVYYSGKKIRDNFLTISQTKLTDRNKKKTESGSLSTNSVINIDLKTWHIFQANIF